MSKLYTAKDLELLIKQGQCLDQVPADAKLTPMARDLMRQHHRSAPKKSATPAAAAAAGGPVKIHEPVLPNAVYDWKPGGDA
ncbi:MAG: class II aldolase/adducin family protein, partial [Opitutaceae bacterium]